MDCTYIMEKQYLLMQDYVVHISSSHKKCRHLWHHNIKFAFTCIYPFCIAKHFFIIKQKPAWLKDYLYPIQLPGYLQWNPLIFLLDSDATNLAGSSLSFTVQYRSLALYVMQIYIFYHRYAKIWSWKYPFHTAITWWCLSWSALPTRSLHLDFTSCTWRNFLWNKQGK